MQHKVEQEPSPPHLHIYADKLLFQPRQKIDAKRLKEVEKFFGGKLKYVATLIGKAGQLMTVCEKVKVSPTNKLASERVAKDAIVDKVQLTCESINGLQSLVNIGDAAI